MKASKLFISLVAVLMTVTATANDSIPVHRPLIEEYTGTWCGWCVRGIAGMELLSSTFGDDFIGVAYHNGDAMEIMYTTQFPNDISGFPSAYIDRTYEVDPLYGFGNTSGGIVSDMQQIANMEVIAGIDLTAQWTSADRTDIKVDLSSYFTVDDNSGKYAIEVMLIADDLYGTGSSWNQANYYSGYSAYAKDKYLGSWVKKPGTVTGWHFNDVLVGTSRPISGSLPSNIVAFENYSFKYNFTLSKLPKPSLIQNKDFLHVIAIIVDTATNKVINANKCYIDDYKAIIIGDVDNDGNVNISDVTTLIDYLLNSESTTINIDNSDVDSDGEINIADVTALIDLLLTSAQ